MMAYILSYEAHTDPKAGTDHPANAWVLDGDSLPVQVKGNEADSNLRKIHLKTEPWQGRRLVTELKRAWELRIEALKKVAD